MLLAAQGIRRECFKKRDDLVEDVPRICAMNAQTP